ncbi:MAG: TIM-barrel domain-containing protein [bacterium]
MRKSEILKLIILTVSLMSLSSTKSFSQHEKIIALPHAKMRLQFFSPSVVRVTVTKEDNFIKGKSLIVSAEPKQTIVIEEEITSGFKLRTERLLIKIDKNDGSIVFVNNNVEILLISKAIDNTSFVQNTVENQITTSIKQNFQISSHEGLYGLGQFEDGVVNWRGHDVLLVQANRIAVNPFLISTKGYGILWDNYSKSRFKDCDGETYFWSEDADEINYYFVYGSNMDKVIAGYRELTGQAPMFGKWAYGYWQSKERYKTADELLETLKEYRRRKIPIDNMIQDWSYWTDGEHFSSMEWDESRYPETKNWVDGIHNLNAHLAVSIWPAFGVKSNIFKEMEQNNLLYPPVHWCGGKVYDAYNPLAREIYWKFVKKGFFDIGVDGYWMDATEPEFRCTDDRYATELSFKESGKNYLGSASRFLNTYSLFTTKIVYKQQRKLSDKKRVFILTRSSFAGQQGYGAVTWSGDTFASFENLKIQVAAGINISMSGIPYWNSDIGGFITGFKYPEGCNDPAYRELYVRWFQFGTFCPMFRSHGTNTPREVWQFGEPGEWAYDALVKFDILRYKLLPYIYSIAHKVTSEGYSFIRGLPMDFRNDPHTFSINGQFMFGTSMMVCPVTKEMYFKTNIQGVDISPDHFYSADGKEHGTELKIFRGTGFNIPVLTRKLEASQIGWSGCLPADLDTAYSLQIEGKILSDNAGEYIFSIQTDGGVQVWIDNKLLIDKWDNTQMGIFPVTLILDAKQKYNFRLYHNQSRENYAMLKVTWIRPTNEDDSKQIDVYLPGETTWFDFWTGKVYEGGQTVKADAPIEIIPVFIPAGSIIPLGPELKYSTEKNADPIELRIYPGKDGSFELYEDENDNYNYEKGIYSTIKFDWNNAEKKLTIGERQGEFPGMLKERTFNIVLVNEKNGFGDKFSKEYEMAVKYMGEEIKIEF